MYSCIVSLLTSYISFVIVIVITNGSTHKCACCMLSKANQRLAQLALHLSLKRSAALFLPDAFSDRRRRKGSGHRLIFHPCHRISRRHVAYA